jgi:hypothetical protein
MEKLATPSSIRAQAGGEGGANRFPAWAHGMVEKLLKNWGIAAEKWGCKILKVSATLGINTLRPRRQSVGRSRPCVVHSRGG